MTNRERYRKFIGLGIEHLATIVEWHVKDIRHEFHQRFKSENEIIKKLRLYKFQDVLNLRDIYAYRILVDECYISKIHKRLSTQFDVIEVKDFISNPKPIGDTGFQHKCLQLTLLYNHCLFEVQITTRAWHTINERYHDWYKKKKYGLD